LRSIFAGDDPASPLRVGVAGEPPRVVEVDEQQGPCLVQQRMRQGWPWRAGRLVLGDGDGEGRDLAVDGVGGGGGAAVDQVDRL
jgi:hypothetical protein